MSFWIKPEAISARVSLGVTILLTLLYQHGKSQESLPHVSYFKMVDGFMLMSTIFVFLALIELCLIIRILEGFQIKISGKVEQVVATCDKCKVRFDDE